MGAGYAERREYRGRSGVSLFWIALWTLLIVVGCIYAISPDVLQPINRRLMIGVDDPGELNAVGRALLRIVGVGFVLFGIYSLAVGPN